MLSFEPKARTFENLYYKSSLVAREVIVPKCLKAPPSQTFAQKRRASLANP